MKKILLLTLALTVCAAGASMADHIGIYADAAGVDCFDNTLAFPPTTNPVYIVHKFNGGTGSTASQFKVNDTTGLFNGGASTSYLLIGAFTTGASVAYGGCLGGDIVVGQINYLWFGAPLTCGALQIVADPTAVPDPVLTTVDCNFTLKPTTGGSFFFNQNGTCPCQDPNATSQSTWGNVKSLYR